MLRRLRRRRKQNKPLPALQTKMFLSKKTYLAFEKKTLVKIDFLKEESVFDEEAKQCVL